MRVPQIHCGHLACFFPAQCTVHVYPVNCGYVSSLSLSLSVVLYLYVASSVSIHICLRYRIKSIYRYTVEIEVHIERPRSVVTRHLLK